MSKLFNLNIQDWIKGLAVAILASILTFILNLLQNDADIDWKKVGTVALISGISYLLKNVLSDGNGKIVGIPVVK